MRTFVTIILTLVALVAVWFFSVWDTEALHYRLQLEVDTPSGPRSGASVVKVRWEDTTGLPLPGTGVGHAVTGEAVVVDLGEGRYLFSLLKGDNWKSSPNGLPLTWFDPNGQSLHYDGKKFPSVMSFVRYLNRVEPKAVLPADSLPMLVTFGDITKPETVKRVDPGNLAVTFGEGYALKSIRMEITNESVTDGRVESVLRWLSEYYDKRLDGRRIGSVRAENRLANSLAAGAFDTERD